MSAMTITQLKANIFALKKLLTDNRDLYTDANIHLEDIPRDVLLQYSNELSLKPRKYLQKDQYFVSVELIHEEGQLVLLTLHSDEKEQNKKSLDFISGAFQP